VHFFIDECLCLNVCRLYEPNIVSLGAYPVKACPGGAFLKWVLQGHTILEFLTP